MGCLTLRKEVQHTDNQKGHECEAYKYGFENLDNVNLKGGKDMQKQGKRRLLILGTGILFFTLMGILTVGATSSVAKQVSWNLQSAYVPGDLAYQLVADFAKKVKEATKGEVEITVHTEGAVVPTNGIFDSVSKGVVEGGHAAGVYYSGKIPVGLMEIGAPYQFESGEDFYNIVYKRGGMEIFRAAYAEHNNFLLGFPQRSLRSIHEFPNSQS